MTYVTLRSDFAINSEYRLLAVEADCVDRLKAKVAARTRETEEEEDDRETLLMMKGTSNLLLCDDDHTYRLRRVEYSNTLLLAEERPMSEHDVDAAAGLQRSIPNDSAVTGMKNRCKQVVVSAVERLFEAKPSCAYRDSLMLLKARPITIEELECENKKELCETNDDNIIEADSSFGNSNNQRYYTFPQLVARSRCSAHELADILDEAGAIVHHGYVRLLHPSLLREALRAVIVFLEGSEEASWEAVEAHLCPSVYPSIVVSVIRKVYGVGEPVDEGNRGAATAAARLLHIRKVLITLAEDSIALLMSRNDNGGAENGAKSSFPSVEFDEFYNMWTDNIPASFFMSGDVPPRSETMALMSLLNAFVILSGARGASLAGARVLWAPQDELSTELSRRMEQLFELNPERWEADALRAYVEPLLDPGMTFEQVVHRHAREFRAPNHPVKYGKLA